MRFGDDWTGIFIRGDNAFYFAHQLRAILELIEEHAKEHNFDGFVQANIGGLVDLLTSSTHGAGKEPEAQTMKNFEDCFIIPSDTQNNSDSK